VHHVALPWAGISAFMLKLRRQPGISAMALEFTILTAARTGEVLGARWSEIDLAAAIWTVPAQRMKAGQEHRVPLAGPALALLRRARPSEPDAAALVFPGFRAGRPLSDKGMPALLYRMGHGEVTMHGFRSTFRDWAGETTGYPREVIEMALAHRLGDKAEQAYARGDLFAKRARLMEEWAGFCAQAEPASGEVVPLRAVNRGNAPQ
jgi:integrase